MKVLLIINPASGKGRGNIAGKKLAKALAQHGVSTHLLETKQAGDAARFAGETADAEWIVSVGGDGTLNEVLNGLKDGSDIKLAQLPLGTANVLAKEFGLTADPGGLAKLIAEDTFRMMDVLLVNEKKKCLLMASAGFDAWVVHELHARRQGPINMLMYPAIGFELIKNLKPWKLEVYVDDRLVSSTASQVVIANVASYGGPLRMISGARSDDGLIDVLCFEGKGVFDLFRFFTASVVASSDMMANAKIYQGKTIELKEPAMVGNESCPTQMDGEPFGTVPIQFRILPNALKIAAPKTT